MSSKDKQPEPPASVPKRARAKKLTGGQLIEQYAAQDGLCYVTGARLDKDCKTVDGKLVTGDVAKLSGGRYLGKLRTKLGADLKKASDLLATYGRLRDEKGIVIFAGERTAASVSPLAEEPAGGAGGRLSAAGGAGE